MSYKALADAVEKLNAGVDSLGKRMADMDAGRSAQPGRKKMYPGYTTEDLEKTIAKGGAPQAMIEEVAARKSGASKTFVTPQIEGGGKPQPKVKGTEDEL
jgi:hypothetical protein